MDKFDALVYLVQSAPEPTQEQVGQQMHRDKQRNPHNDSHKPKLRDSLEIVVDYKLEFANMMLNKIEQQLS